MTPRAPHEVLKAWQAVRSRLSPEAALIYAHVLRLGRVLPPGRASTAVRLPRETVEHAYRELVDAGLIPPARHDASGSPIDDRRHAA